LEPSTRFRVLLAAGIAVVACGCSQTVISEYAEPSKANATDFIRLVPDLPGAPICKDLPFFDPKAPENGIDRIWAGLYYPTEMLYGLPEEKARAGRRNADPYELIEDAVANRDRELRDRANDKGFLELCALLVREFRVTKRLAILEFYETPYGQLRYGFVLLAETSSGYVAAGNMPWWRELRGSPGRVRTWRVDQARAKQWFDRIEECSLPDAGIFTRHNLGTVYPAGGSLFMATVGRSATGDYATHSTLNVEFNDLVLQEMIRDYEPLRPAATDEEARQILKEAPCERPGKSGPALFPGEENKPRHIPTPLEYDRVRNRYAAAIAPLWEITQGLPNLKDVGGFAGAVDRLRKLEGIAGYQVVLYDYSGEGDFYWLSKALCREGTQEQFRSLVADPNPTVRAMGLVCIARTATTEVAGNVLRPYLRSRTKINVRVLDHNQDFDEGRLAWVLLRNVNFLHMDMPARPSVPRTEQMAIDLEILAADDMPHLRLNAASALEFRLATNELDLSLPALEKMCPRLSRLQIVKAVGRIRPTPGKPWADRMRAFLTACLNNASLETDCRLAACSALACDPSEQVDRVIEAHKDWLEKCVDRDLFARFQEDRAAARLYGAALQACLRHAALRKDHPGLQWNSPEDLKAETRADDTKLGDAILQASLRLLEFGHPLNPSELDHHLRSVYSTPDLSGPAYAGQKARWAYAVSARLADYTQPWDTFAYMAADLDQKLQGDLEYAQYKREWAPNPPCDRGPTFEETLGGVRYQTLVENVQQAVKRQADAAGRR
jgi:hypothetical protein